MREETRRKFDAEIAKCRIWSPYKSFGVIATIVTVFCMWTYLLTPFWVVEKMRDVEGIVTFASVLANKEFGSHVTSIQARLDHGGMVQAYGLPQMPPRIGDRIVLAESRVGYWGIRYVWTGERK
jgi:hypothetical protein